MLEDEEDEHHEDKALEANANLEDLVEVLHDLVALLDNLEHADHPSHSDDLVELADSGHSGESVQIANEEDQVEGDDGDHIDGEPGLKVLLRDGLKNENTFKNAYPVVVYHVIFGIIVGGSEIDEDVNEKCCIEEHVDCEQRNVHLLSFKGEFAWCQHTCCYQKSKIYLQ